MSLFDLKIKDGALGLLADLAQPMDILAPTESLSSDKFCGSYTSFLEK